MSYRYFIRYDIDTKQVDVLWRIENMTAIYERWDRISNVWIADARGIAETGIGGDPNYDDVSIVRARHILANWGAPAGSEAW
jgi:hypothetical protein